MQKILAIIKTNQKMLIDFSVAAVCLLLFSIFPANDFSQKLTKSFFFFLFIPYLYIKYLLKKNLSDFGFNFQNKKNGFILGVLALAVSFLLIYLLTTFTDFKKNYVLPTSISHNFYIFIFYELILVNVLFFLQEYFFKGFLIAIFQKKLGFLSVPIQAIIYLIPLWIFSGSFWQIIPWIILSFAGGIIAYRNKTFVYSYFFGIVFLILTDAYIIYLQK
jgi:hypothetical protein